MEESYAMNEEGAVGTVKIADDVVAMIAGLAATEIDGVSSLSGTGKNGARNPARGVKVEIIGKRVKVDMAIIVGYGFNIPAISQKAQLKVKAAIENMTGLTVTDVNLRVAGINNIG
jgi:uncharacterized alkaline shock family protein YloU